jgi:hypothetical protein
LLKEFLKVENKKLKQRSVDLCIYGKLHNWSGISVKKKQIHMSKKQSLQF